MLSSRRRLKTKKYKKKSASKSSGMPTTDTDTINKEYWESAVCSKKSVIGGDGWCIGKDAWQRVLDFKAKLRPTLDYEMFQDDCCKYLQVSILSTKHLFLHWFLLHIDFNIIIFYAMNVWNTRKDCNFCSLVRTHPAMRAITEMRILGIGIHGRE